MEGGGEERRGEERSKERIPRCGKRTGRVRKVDDRSVVRPGTGVEEIEVDGGKARGRRRLPVMTRETCERRHGYVCMYVDAGNVRNSYVKRWFEVSGSLIQTSRGHSVADINGF